LFDIGSGAFKPPPKVTSAFLRLVPHPKPPFTISDAGVYAQLVNQAFSMRRKTLRNCLRGFVDEASIKSVDIDPQRRPETLTPSEFAKLANIAFNLHL
jgi:16S rRNA (adenine1518-N6/adenine1519-N6)-dimethyltransferase